MLKCTQTIRRQKRQLVMEHAGEAYFFKSLSYDYVLKDISETNNL